MCSYLNMCFILIYPTELSQHGYIENAEEKRTNKKDQGNMAMHKEKLHTYGIKLTLFF